VTLVALAGLIALDELLVRALFDSHYLSLYLRYGALSNLVVVLFVLAWGDIERHTSLISAHPTEYSAGYISVSLALFASWGALIAPGRKQRAQSLAAQSQLRAALAAQLAKLREAAGAWPPATQQAERLEQLTSSQKPLPWVPIGLGAIDFVMSLVLGLGLLLALAAWVLLVVPAQYFVYLVAAAPARQAVGSPERAWARVARGEIMVRSDSKDHEIPEGATESGFSAKPVTFTAALAAALVFALQQILG
jgi:hypothetical protein